MTRAPRPAPRRAPGPGLVLAAVLVVGLGVSGCVSVPTSGSVRTVEEAPSTESALVKTPGQPVPGAPPSVVVAGFLDSMEAFPISTRVATAFLTAEAAQRWQPDRRTVVYETQSTVDRRGTGSTRRVVADIGTVARLSSRGTYRPVTRQDASTRVRFGLVRVDGEWRIDDPPDVTYIDTSFFEDYYEAFDLFFIQPGRRTLVADPVYLPIGEQLATELVRGVLAGPTRWLGRQAGTLVPASAQVQVSVPVRDDGTAEVQLSEPVTGLSDDELRLLSGQLAWTLRQVPGLYALRISVSDTVLDVSGGDVQPVSAFADLDPSGPPTRSELYALTERGALMLVGADEPLPGTWGARSRRLADFSVDRGLVRAAGVAQQRRRLLAGPLGAADGDELGEWYVAEGRLSEPQWDAAGQLWVLDRAGGSTTWVTLTGPDDARTVRAGPLSQVPVSAMAVSADGARVAAVVDRWDGPVWGGGTVEGPAVVVARVRRDNDGRVLGLDQAYAVPTQQSRLERLGDVAWSGPTLVTVLGRVVGSAVQPYQLRIDGSELVGGALTLEPELPGSARSLAAADVGGAVTVVGIDDGRLLRLGPDNEWATVDVGMRAPHYPG